MSREWIENPNTEQRCQIAADRMLTAIMQENENTKILMAGYILSRMPKATDVRIDTSGEILGTEFIAY
jgi:phosphoribosyl-AMP cyclohydrolase